jgi:GT2 family glycosyltransferase
MSGLKSATVVITTRNRKDELRNAIKSALAQTVPVEILVIDDGSIDGTAEMVCREFPSVRLERSENSLGYISQRNRGAQWASSNTIFSLDDDAIFTSPHTVAQTLAEFDHPRVGAVAIPYVEPRKSAIMHQKAPSRDELFITDRFIGTAHALRKDVFLKLGGYREHFFHQGEESDYSIRMMEAGYLVRLGNADPIHHMESPRRDLRRMDYYGHRNNVLFAWHNVPMPHFPIHLLGTTLNGFALAFRTLRFQKMLQGIVRGYIDCFRWWKKRRPVSQEVYRLHRLLKKQGPQLLSDIERSLPVLEGSIS